MSKNIPKELRPFNTSGANEDDKEGGNGDGDGDDNTGTYTLRTRTQRRRSSRRATTTADDLNSDDAVASIDKGATKTRCRTSTAYNNDDEEASISSSQPSDDYDDDDTNDDDDDNDEDFVTPNNKKSKKKKTSTTSTLKSGTTNSSVKMKKIASEKALNEKINTLKANDLPILIRAYRHEQATDKSKPEWCKANGGYTKHYKIGVTTKTKNGYKKIKQYFVTQVEEVDCELVEYQCSFLFSDGKNKSAPLDIRNINMYNTKSNVIDVISSDRELLEACVTSGRIIELTNQEDDEYLNIGEDNDSDDNAAADDDDISSIGLNSSISMENRTLIGNRNRCESTDGTSLKAILLDVIVRVKKNKKKKDNNKDIQIPKKIRLNVHGLVHTDVNKDVKSYWVPNDIIGNIPIDFEDIGITFRVGHIIRAIRTIAINHDNDAQEKIGALSCLFLLANNRERNDIVLKRMLSSADLLNQLKKLVHSNNIRNIDDVPTLVVAVGIGAREEEDDKEEMPTMTDSMARNYSSNLSRVSSPKLMNIKSSSKIERQATRSHNQSNRDLFRKLYFGEDSPFQYLFSREMEVVILNRMETDKVY